MVRYVSSLDPDEAELSLLRLVLTTGYNLPRGGNELHAVYVPPKAGRGG